MKKRIENFNERTCSDMIIMIQLVTNRTKYHFNGSRKINQPYIS